MLAGEITAFADGDPAEAVVLGLSDGRVGRWNGLDSEATLHQAHDGRVVAVGAAETSDVVSLSSAGAVARTTIANGVTKRLGRVNLDVESVSTAAFSPNGTQILVGEVRGAIRVFDTSSGRQRHALTGHRADLHALVMPPGTAVLASAAADADLRIWDLSTGRELHLADTDLAMIAAAFSPRDGSLIAGGTDRRVTRRTGSDWKSESLVTLKAPEIVIGLAWSPDAATIAVASADETSLAKGWLRLIDVARRSVIAELDTRGQPAWYVAFVDNDTVVANVASGLTTPAEPATSILYAWDR
jgi:WD40 repeat protein